MVALQYDLGPGVEAFSTYKRTPLDFEVTMPLHQSHSTTVVKLPGEETDLLGADGIITNQSGLRIGVKTADCVPILLYDPVNRAVAAVHSGWKGTLGGISMVAVDRMRAEYGSEPSAMRAVIGPCIHQAAFEVGDELWEQFAAAGYGRFCAKMPDYDTHRRIKWHIDLPGICEAQLQAQGLAQIQLRPECTYMHHHDFYSARRLRSDFKQQRIYNCIQLL